MAAGFVGNGTLGAQNQYVSNRVQMDQFTAYQQLQNMGGNGYHMQQFGGLDARSGQAQQMQHGQQDLN